MDVREKLVELLEEAEGLVNNNVPSLEQIADHILASDFINELQNEAYDLGVESTLRHKFGLSWDDAAGLCKEIKRLQDATKWIPVTERLPDVNKFVLVYGEGIVGEATRDGTDGKFYWAGSDEYCSAIDVTHWMPLPSPPKGE